MSSVAIRLRANLPEILAAIRRGRAPAACRDDLLVFLPDALHATSRRLAPLQRANAERHAHIREAIHRAADKALTERIRQIYPARRSWCGLLQQWLSLRYGSFGLEGCPCRRVIRAALK